MYMFQAYEAESKPQLVANFIIRRLNSTGQINNENCTLISNSTNLNGTVLQATGQICGKSSNSEVVTKFIYYFLESVLQIVGLSVGAYHNLTTFFE